MGEFEDIKRKLDGIESNWIHKKNEKEQNEQNEVKEFATNEWEQLNLLYDNCPKEFEQLYWETHIIVERDCAYSNSFTGVLACIAMAISAVSLVFTVIDSLKFPFDFYDWIITGGVGIMTIISISLALSYVRCLFATRKRSCYRTRLAMMEEIKNRKENTPCTVQNAETN